MAHELRHQLPPRIMRWLLQDKERKTEVCSYRDPDVEPTFEKPTFTNLLVEFNHDPKLGILLADGPGHAFFRVSYLEEVLEATSSDITDFLSLAKEFLIRGYHIKRVYYAQYRRKHG